MMEGYISSIETMGLVDGPGIRYVVFMQGCKLRCLFCHNPETWELQKGLKITSDELLKRILKYKNYFGSDGGVTFSGGEPLLQSEFLIDILKKCQQNGIHTCLDTAGFGGTKNEEILKYTDLVMMDIKALEDEKYEFMTGQKIKESLEFLELCKKLKKTLWIRQVIVPTINDNKEYIKKLKLFLSKYNIDKVEFLPYTTIGIPKYKKLKIKYRLQNIEAMDKKKCEELYKLYEKI